MVWLAHVMLAGSYDTSLHHPSSNPVNVTRQYMGAASRNAQFPCAGEDKVLMLSLSTA